MNSNDKHWDSLFSKTEDAKLGWYEKDVSQTLALLSQIPDFEHSTIFLPGAGTSLLIDDLLSRGAKLVLNDISIEALNRVRQRLGDKAKSIVWLCQSIAQPIDLANTPKADVWIDRAVLHFLTDEEDIKRYFENLKSVLKPGGHVVFAEFSMTGALQCAGLPLHRYSVEQFSERLGSSFKLISNFAHTFINPYGDPRPYVYALYKRET